MDLQVIVPIGCSVLSAGCAVFVAVRAARWRDSDEAQAITDRLTGLERSAEAVKGVPATVKTLGDDVLRLDGRVTAIEGEIADLPTKGDIRALDERVMGLGREQSLTRAGVERIETLFIQRGLERA